MSLKVGDHLGRMFFSTFEFERKWEEMGLDDEDQRQLENEIIANPQVGSVIPGSGGLRKMRFALEGKGKRSGARVLYVDFVVFERIYLVTAYPKNETVNLSPAEIKLFKKLIDQTRKELEGTII